MTPMQRRLQEAIEAISPLSIHIGSLQGGLDLVLILRDARDLLEKQANKIRDQRAEIDDCQRAIDSAMLKKEPVNIEAAPPGHATFILGKASELRSKGPDGKIHLKNMGQNDIGFYANGLIIKAVPCPPKP